MHRKGERHEISRHRHPPLRVCDAFRLGDGARLAVRADGISDMERGLKVPSLTTILRLAVALDCKVTALTSVFDTVDLPAILPK